MKSITVALSAADLRISPDVLSDYLRHWDIEEIIAISTSCPEMEGVRIVEGKSIFSGMVMKKVLETGPSGAVQVIESFEEAIETLFPFSEYYKAGREFFLLAVQGPLPPAGRATPPACGGSLTQK